MRSTRVQHTNGGLDAWGLEVSRSLPQPQTRGAVIPWRDSGLSQTAARAVIRENAATDAGHTVTTIAPTWMRALDSSNAVDLATSEPSEDVLRLFETHGAPLYRFCCFTLGRQDEAEDVVQETFLKLLEHLRASGGQSNLRAWLFTVAANACRDRLRWRIRWVPWRAELDERLAESPDDTVSSDVAGAALSKLPPRDRLLLSLRAQGLSYREIAVAAGVRETSVGRFLARAVERWKRQAGPRI